MRGDLIIQEKRIGFFMKSEDPDIAFKIDPDLIIHFQKDKHFSKFRIEHLDKFKTQ
jgi:hypothetical protein